MMEESDQPVVGKHAQSPNLSVHFVTNTNLYEKFIDIKIGL